MDTKDDLRKKVDEGIALSELRNANGWREYISILKEKYIDALQRLSKAEDVEARAVIKVLEDIVSIIDDKISLGSQAREELKNQIFKDQE